MCRAFATRSNDRFAGLHWRPSANGAPRLDGVAAWIDCDVERTVDAGDHLLVIGAIRALDIAVPGPPLLFFAGGYGRFWPGPLTTVDPTVADQMPMIDAARAPLAALAEKAGVPAVALLRAGDDLVLAASAHAPHIGGFSTWIGTHVPNAPPFNHVFAAFGDGPGSGTDACERVRARGFSVAMRAPALEKLEFTVDRLAREGRQGDANEVRPMVSALAAAYDPPELPGDRVDGLLAPVFDADGSVAMAVALRPLPTDRRRRALDWYRDLLLARTREIGLILSDAA